MAEKYATIGLGKFGYSVTKVLFDEGHDVIAMDLDKEKVQKARECSSQAIAGDATQKEILETFGLEEMDAVVVSMGGNPSAATLVTLYLNEMGVKRIIVKANDEDHGRILKRLGASDVVYPEQDIAVKVARNLSHPNMLEYFPMADDYMAAQIVPDEPFIGKSLATLQLRTKFNINVIGIKRELPGKSFFVPSSEYVIRSSDTLLVVGSEEDIGRLREVNKGDQ
ncbi:MAG TPA: TrkA family potassium uptake protein [Candidatus Krumholzibacteriaceae bacterium]|nr:TrkA family potassium uptake protein [Candidatus Krumholzibacteriaceae bacterium]